MLTNQTIPFDLRALEVFLSVCDNEGIAAAARKLGVSQPAVSLRITELEASVGLPLFDRSVRPALLTPVGLVLRDRARSLISEASSIAPELHQVGKSILPFLRVGAVDSATRTLFPVILPFLARQAQQIGFSSGASSTHASELLLRRLDIAVTSSPLHDLENVERWPLVKDEHILAIPRSMDASCSWSTVADLAAVKPFLRFTRSSSAGLIIDMYLRRLRVEVQVQAELETCQHMAEALMLGYGWAIVTPICCIQGQLDLDKVNLYALPEPGIVRELTLIARKKELGSVPQQLALLCKTALEQELAKWTGRVRERASCQ